MFYDKFASLCAQRGVSPSRAAQEAGLSKSTVTKWKNSPTSTPTGAAIEKLTAYFGITAGELLGESADILSQVDVAFYGDYQELSEDDKQTLRDMARVMRARRKREQEQ